MSFKFINFGLMISLITLLLTSCGGDSSSSSGTTSVTASDPYVEGAIFTWNGNDSSQSDQNGLATFNLEIPNGEIITQKFTAIGYGYMGGLEYKGKLKTISNGSGNSVASPMTTLKANGWSDSEILDLINGASPTYTLTAEDIQKDPMLPGNENLLVQNMALTEALLSTTTSNGFDSTPPDAFDSQVLKDAMAIFDDIKNSTQTSLFNSPEISSSSKSIMLANLAFNITKSAMPAYIDSSGNLKPCGSQSCAVAVASIIREQVLLNPTATKLLVLVNTASVASGSPTAISTEITPQYLLMEFSKQAQLASSQKLQNLFHPPVTAAVKSLNEILTFFPDHIATSTSNNWTLLMTAGPATSTQNYFTNLQFKVDSDCNEDCLVKMVHGSANEMCFWATVQGTPTDYYNPLPPEGDGFLKNGEYSVTFNQALLDKIATNCGATFDLPLNETVKYKIETIDGSLLNKKISLFFGGATTAQQFEFYRIDRLHFNYTSYGDDWRDMFFYDVATNSVSFETAFINIPGQGNHRSVKRAFVDNNQNTANIMVNDPGYDTYFTIAGKTSGDRKLQLSQTIGGLDISKLWMEDCINSNVFPSIVSSSGYGSCGITSNLLVYSQPGNVSNPSKVFGELYALDVTTNSNWNCLDKNSNLNFDATTIYSSSVFRGYCGTVTTPPTNPPSESTPSEPPVGGTPTDAAAALIAVTNEAEIAAVDTLNRMFQPFQTVNAYLDEVFGSIGVEPNQIFTDASATNKGYWVETIKRFGYTTSGPLYTTPEYFQDYQFNKNAQNLEQDQESSLVELQSLVKMTCLWAVLQDYNHYPFSSDGFLADGPYSATYTTGLKNEMIGRCGIDADLPDDTVITYTVSSPVGTSFNKQINGIFVAPDGGSDTEIDYFKISSDAFNVARVNAVPSDASREMFFQDKRVNSKTIRYEKVTLYNDFNFSNLVRAFINNYDATNAIANVMYNAGNATPTYDNRFTIDAEINGTSSGKFSQISFQSPNFGGGIDAQDIPLDVMDVCINSNGADPTLQINPTYTDALFITCPNITSNIKVTGSPPANILNNLNSTLNSNPNWYCLDVNSSPVFTNGSQVYSTPVKTNYCP